MRDYIHDNFLKLFKGTQDYYYEPEDGYMFPKPYKGQSLISYLDSRSYDTGAELDRVIIHLSFPPCIFLYFAYFQMIPVNLKRENFGRLKSKK